MVVLANQFGGIMRFIRHFTLAVVLASSSVALAQTAPAPTNPLRPSTGRTATPPPATPPAAAPASTPTPEATKQKRPRSEAQLANDNRMRACGAEWRANKASLQAQGKTWRVFNVECRARLKAQGR